MHRLTAIFCLLAFVTSVAPAVAQQKRFALVVGNSNYRSVPNLANAEQDAHDVGAALTRLGFSVKPVMSANYEVMRQAIRDFQRQAIGAEMAVIFFAGHGIEARGENWLIPTDADLRSDSEPDTQAINLNIVTRAVSGATALGLVILDACRNNPFVAMERTSRTRAIDRGLAPVEPSGVLVAFAAKHGTTASDGKGRNSPFTAALLRHIETAGLEVEILFRHVRDDVLRSTQNQQEPFKYGSLSSRLVYLKAPADALAMGEDEVAWRLLMKAAASAEFNDLVSPSQRAAAEMVGIQQFVAQFPRSRHLTAANVRLLELRRTVALNPPTMQETEDEVLWRRLQDTASGALFRAASPQERHVMEARGLEEFVRTFPQSKRVPEARARLAVLVNLVPPSRQPLASSLREDDILWQSIKNAAAAAQLDPAFKDFPRSRLILEARGIAEFLRKFPTSRHAGDARKRLEELQRAEAAAGPSEVEVPPSQNADDTFTLQVCNQSRYAALVATSGRPASTQGWRVQGWAKVPVNACRDVGSFLKGTFFATARGHRKAAGWSGKDFKLCVQNTGAFDRPNSPNYKFAS
jgi:hypothetical protein